MAETRVPAVGAEGWFTTDPPALLGQRCGRCETIAFPPTSRFCPNPACDGGEDDLAPHGLAPTGTIWSYTDARYAPPPPYVGPDRALRAVHAGRGRGRRVGAGGAGADGRRRHARRPGRGPAGRAGGRHPVRRDGDTDYTMWRWRPIDTAGEALMADDVVVAGAGMTAWGKWGRSFVDYGVAAAREALADAGVGVDRHRVRGRRRDGPQRLRRLRRRRVHRPGARVDRRPGRHQLRRLRVGRPGHRRRPRPHPGRAVRRRPGGGGRHDAQGVPGAQRRRPPRRPRLAALPPAGRHQPGVLRPLRPAPHGPLRRHAEPTSPR